MERFSALLNKIKETFGTLPLSQKILYAGSGVVLLGSLVYLAYSVNRVDYARLYSGLPEAELAPIVKTLKAKKIPYKLAGAGTISVPASELYEARLVLASEGLPKGPGVGFEIFDKQQLGTTEFVQKINYQRALQGELARTIKEMDQVVECRVHLVLPKNSLFVEEAKPARAAVFLKLKPGARLSAKRLNAIVHLVSSSVQDLSPENVTVMSTDGKVFFKKEGSDSPEELSDIQLAIKEKLENNLRNKVQDMLARVLGPDKIVAQVSADLDFSRAEIDETLFDPDSAVIRSQQRSIENSEKPFQQPKGNPDAPINIQGRLLRNTKTVKTPTSFQRQKETVNYEINKTTRRIVRTPGAIKRLSVAVVIDGPYRTERTAKGQVKKVFVGRSAKEIKAIEDMVKKAVGYDEGRGDQVSVTNLAFASSQEIPAPPPKILDKWLAIARHNQKIIFNVLLTLLVFVFVIRPFMKHFQKLAEEKEEKEEAMALPPGEEESLLEAPEVRPPSLREQAAAMVQENPKQAALVIRAWLNEEA